MRRGNTPADWPALVRPDHRHGDPAGGHDRPEGPSPELRNSSSALLGYLSLLFVPAAVGIMPHLSILRAQWLPVVIALFVSTFLGMATAALVVQAMNRRARTPQPSQPATARLESMGGAGD